jgi:hypothetical protein
VTTATLAILDSPVRAAIVTTPSLFYRAGRIRLNGSIPVAHSGERHYSRIHGALI